MMPRLDGWETASRLRDDPETAHIKVVLLSARAQEADLQRGERIGVDAYLTKPFDPDELIDTVRRLMARRRTPSRRETTAAAAALAAVAGSLSRLRGIRRQHADRAGPVRLVASLVAVGALHTRRRRCCRFPDDGRPCRPRSRPWPAPVLIDQGEQSAAYVAAAGLPYAEEMLPVHYHAHLDIIVDGKAVRGAAVPRLCRDAAKAVGLAPLHTHEPNGIIHIENGVPATFVLGQFFIEWGVRFTSTCLGAYCAGSGKELAFFVDGKRSDRRPDTHRADQARGDRDRVRRHRQAADTRRRRTRSPADCKSKINIVPLR